MRGDRPSIFGQERRTGWFTPHARGSTQARRPMVACSWVYPACAGIDPSLGITSMLAACLPRMRGDRPAPGPDACGGHWFTPHARGSTLGRENHYWRREVYPACAGIDPTPLQDLLHFLRLPRMRGDRPKAGAVSVSPAEFTPHARGSTSCIAVSFPFSNGSL